MLLFLFYTRCAVPLFLCCFSLPGYHVFATSEILPSLILSLFSSSPSFTHFLFLSYSLHLAISPQITIEAEERATVSSTFCAQELFSVKRAGQRDRILWFFRDIRIVASIVRHYVLREGDSASRQRFIIHFTRIDFNFTVLGFASARGADRTEFPVEFGTDFDSTKI